MNFLQHTITTNYATLEVWQRPEQQRQEPERVNPTLVQSDSNILDDRQLMALMQEQPTVAVAALYDRYGSYVFSVALRMVGDRAVAEEITQDVFLNCWRNAGNYDGQRASVITWLLRIAHNRAIDELRSRRNQHRKREMTWEQAPPDRLASEREMDAAMVQSEVREALATLPTNQREAVEMLYFGGLSRQEIADKLSAPLGTINTRLRLGMEKLRALLVPSDS